MEAGWRVAPWQGKRKGCAGCLAAVEKQNPACCTRDGDFRQRLNPSGRASPSRRSDIAVRASRHGRPRCAEGTQLPPGARGTLPGGAAAPSRVTNPQDGFLGVFLSPVPHPGGGIPTEPDPAAPTALVTLSRWADCPQPFRCRKNRAVWDKLGAQLQNLLPRCSRDF